MCFCRRCDYNQMYQFDKCSTERVSQFILCGVRDWFFDNQYLLGKGLVARRLEDVVPHITHGTGICITKAFYVVLDSIKVSLAPHVYTRSSTVMEANVFRSCSFVNTLVRHFWNS